MTRVRIKFCGMTRVADACAAAELGVDAIGLVFAARSPRCVSLTQACRIRRALPPMVTTVALFVDPDVEQIRSVEKELRPSLLQFHGSEDHDFCARFDTPFLKAIAAGGATDVRIGAGDYPQAAGLLLDGHAPGEMGGKGRAFDWGRVSANDERRIVLAGGLTASNVGSAIRTAQPWAVDVASGVESEPGCKSRTRMQAFIRAVAEAQTT